MQGCVTFIQQTVRYQSVFFVCMSVRYTHTSHSLRHSCLNLYYHVVPLYTPICVGSPASSVPAVCSLPQNFKQEIYFKQLTGFNFYIDQQKGTFLAVSGIRHTFTTTQNKKLLHISCTSHKYYLHLALL